VQISFELDPPAEGASTISTSSPRSNVPLSKTHHHHPHPSPSPPHPHPHPSLPFSHSSLLLRHPNPSFVPEQL